mmetsp:Transcript_34961/g.110451  ORF Transcript_34961/g.110451 Transcript_34961/m.110451 type:complete len:275 (-) Transcript_34961:241-1065(-)
MKYTSPLCTAGRVQNPGRAASAATSLSPRSRVAAGGVRTSTSGLSATTWSQLRRSEGSPALSSPSCPPASAIISGIHLPPATIGERPCSSSTRRRSCEATSAATLRSLARSESTRAAAASSAPATNPSCMIDSRTSPTVRGRITMVVVRASERSPASESAAATERSVSPVTSAGSHVMTRVGAAWRSHSPSMRTSGSPRATRSRAAASAAADVPQPSRRLRHAMRRPVPTSRGQSHWSLTPTTRSPRPSTNKISVAPGARLAMPSPPKHRVTCV